MSRIHRVLWEEGTFLSPQHLQLWDRHHAGELVGRMGLLRQHVWGVSVLEIDETVLSNGTLQIRRLAGALRNGFWFDCEQRDPLPNPVRFIERFGQNHANHMDVFVGLPRVPDNGVTCGEEEDGHLPYPFVPGEVQVADASRAGAPLRAIRTAETRIRILIEGEPLDDYDCIQIARIQQVAGGTYALDSTYVPPCISVGASPYLDSLLRTINQSMQPQDDALKRHPDLKVPELRLQMELMAKSFAWPRLSHLHAHRSTLHPEQLFMELVGLAGMLTAFQPGVEPKHLPLYKHEALAETFDNLAAALGITTSGRPVPAPQTGGAGGHRPPPPPPPPAHGADSIPVDSRPPRFIAKIPEGLDLERTDLFVAVRSSMPGDDIVHQVPRMAKIAGENSRLQDLIAFQIAGLGIRHVAVPPPRLAVEPDFLYYQVEKSGEYWDEVCEKRELLMLFPARLGVGEVKVLPLAAS